MPQWFVRKVNGLSQLSIRPRDVLPGDDGMLYWWKFQREEFTHRPVA